MNFLLKVEYICYTNVKQHTSLFKLTSVAPFCTLTTPHSYQDLFKLDINNFKIMIYLHTKKKKTQYLFI